MIGQTIDKYTLEDEIGQGGMAIVYRAHDSKLRRDVAIKLLLPHLLRQPEAVNRFRREAVTVARLSHPNIIDIYDYSGEHSAQPYIVTELIEGQTLRDFVEQQGAIPCELAACIGREIALALIHAHGEGIVHRDLKPENIMIRRDGKIKLMDFGIARVLESATMTLTGSIMGSPAFMSPEQITGKPVGVASDLFSLGSILYVLVCGRPPFAGQNPHEILKRVVDGDREPVQMLAPSVSNRCASLINALHATDPAARPPDAQTVLRELEGILADGGVDSPSEELHRFFADPQGHVARFNEALVRHLGHHAAAQQRRKPALAMQTYSRLLAIQPDHPAATRALDRLIRRRRSLARSRVELAIGAALIVMAVFGAWLLGQHDPTPTVDDAASLASSEAPSTPVMDEPPAPRRDVPTARSAPSRQEGLASPATNRPPDARERTGGEPAPVRKSETPAASSRETPPPSGNLRVVALPWADVYVNGRKVGTSPHTEPFELAPGRNEIRLENPSYSPLVRVIEVAQAGQREFIRHRMERLPGLLKLDNNQQAMVFIDGDFVGYTPLTDPIPVKLSEQEAERKVLVSLTKAGYQPFNTRLTLHPGRTQALSVTLEPKEGGP